VTALRTLPRGTPNYIAPEVLAGSKGSGHSYEVDVWSIGVIMYTLLVGTPPFQTSDVHATYKRIRANAYEFPDKPSVSLGARDLIRWSLAPKPCDRPKIADIAAHPLLRAGLPGWVGGDITVAPCVVLHYTSRSLFRHRTLRLYCLCICCLRNQCVDDTCRCGHDLLTEPERLTARETASTFPTNR
jgi:hypothetical protein